MSKSFKEILEKVKSLPKKTVSVAVAQDSEVLLAVKAAKEKGIADSVRILYFSVMPRRSRLWQKK